MSTLLEAGFSISSLGIESAMQVADFLEATLAAEGGTAGFASQLMADADDTAKTLLSLILLDRAVQADSLIAKSENGTYFRTYLDERNPSLSANCNVLNALLHLAQPDKSLDHISRAVTFLGTAWHSGSLKDKWNLSKQYSVMLLAQALVQLQRQWDNAKLQALPHDLLQYRVPVVLFQILVRTLQSQKTDGSWFRGSCEVTAYAVLTLVSVSSLPWVQMLRPDILSAINNGRGFLTQEYHRWNKPSYIWVEKVTYSSPVLSQTYCLAAINSPISSSSGTWTEAVKDLVNVSPKAVAKFSQFFSQVPLFSKETHWTLKASIIEGYLFLPQLKRTKFDIFPPKETAEDKYLEYIHFTWTGCNDLGEQINTTTIWDMMVCSMLVYQIDEYMEAVVTVQYGQNLESIRAIISRLFPNQPAGAVVNRSSKRPRSASESEDLKTGLFTPSDISTDSDNNDIFAEIETVISRFTSFFLTHRKVKRSPLSAQHHLRQELFTFLLTHHTQIEDNARFASQVVQYDIFPAFTSRGGTYFDWVRTTSANHTSCPFAFAFFTCLVSKADEELFATVKQKYLAQDLCRHLATMCRQYNDFGSMARDHAEGNLNSVDFAEFSSERELDRELRNTPYLDIKGRINDVGVTGEEGRGLAADTQESRKKEDLFWLAEYERQCLDLAMQKLEAEVGAEAMNAVRLFVNVTDLYGQIYVLRDVTNRVG